MRVAVLGLGEAGSIYAADLVARGAVVTGVDPRVPIAPAGVTRCDDIAAAVASADVVLSLVGESSAADALAEALSAMPAVAVFADMNTGHPDAKRARGAAADARGISFVDVAVLAPVPRARADTPLLLSGAGVATLMPLFRELGLPGSDAGAEPGTAAGLKLLRSVFMKGLAALVLESATAAHSVGAQEWVLDQIASELGGSGPGASGRDLVERMMQGTRQHAVRREAEMRDVRSYLHALGVPHVMTDGTIAWLHALSAETDAAASAVHPC